MKLVYILAHAEARRRALDAVLDAPDGWRVTVQEIGRSGDQNAIFHALCNDAAKSGRQWAGAKRTAEQWKVLFVSGHAAATKQGAEMVPGLENEFVNLRESTAAMGKARATSLIEYVMAWMAQNDSRPSTQAGE